LRKFLIPIALVAVLLAVSCAKNSERAGVKSMKVGTDSIDVAFIEHDSANIALWAKSGITSAILVRLSAYDGLSPVSDTDLVSIKSMVNKDDYAGLASSGDPASKDSLYGPANVVYVAYKLDIIKELYWVIPSFDSVDEKTVEYFKDQLKNLYPDDASEIDNISLSGKSAAGSVNGVPIRMLCLEDLASPGSPVLLDLDSTFYKAMYSNEKNTPSLAYISGIYKILSEVGIKTYSVSVSASGPDIQAALKLRPFSRYMARLFKEPELINSKPPALWVERANAWRLEQNEPSISIPVYNKIIKEYPDDAASRYDLGDAYFMVSDYGKCITEIKAAAGLDPAYGEAFGWYAEHLAKEGKAAQAAMFRQLQPVR
jgi:hypothetical protein